MFRIKRILGSHRLSAPSAVLLWGKLLIWRWHSELNCTSYTWCPEKAAESEADRLLEARGQTIGGNKFLPHMVVELSIEQAAVTGGRASRDLPLGAGT
jgi:hypothetical protein